jgi:hypothetical protein
MLCEPCPPLQKAGMECLRLRSPAAACAVQLARRARLHFAPHPQRWVGVSQEGVCGRVARISCGVL